MLPPMKRHIREAARTLLPDVIETDRLVLRPFRLTDLDDVLAYTRDPEWARFMRSPPYGRVEAERAVAAQVTFDRHSRPSWAFVLDGAVIGGLTLIFDFENRSAEVGYSVAREQWGRGLCTEALRAIVDVTFTQHQELNRIHARTDPANVASQRVLEKSGLVREGVLRAYRVVDEVSFDEMCFSILRSEWKIQS